MKRSTVVTIATLVGIVALAGFYVRGRSIFNGGTGNIIQDSIDEVKQAVSHPLAIESLRLVDTPGSELVIEETLPNG